MQKAGPSRAERYMMHTLTIVLVATMPLFLVVLVVSFVVFDRLLRIQFSDAHSDWEREGCPSGYFWAPPSSRKLSPRARGYLYSKWFYHAPPWVRGSQQAERLYARFKLMVWLGIIAFSPVFMAIVLLIVNAVHIVLRKLTGIDFSHP